MTTAVGRERELEQVAAFLDLQGGARVLLLEGEPGIGKTTVWEEAAAAALPDRRVLRARPLEVEARISFAAVGDLLAGSLDEVRADVPAPQLRALEVALLLADPGTAPPDPTAIAFAFLSALRRWLGPGRSWSPSTTCNGWINRRPRFWRVACGVPLHAPTGTRAIAAGANGSIGLEAG